MKTKWPRAQALAVAEETQARLAPAWEAWSCDLLPSETPGNHYQEENGIMFGTRLKKS